MLLGIFIIAIATIFIVYNICKIFGVTEKNRGISKAEQYIKEDRKTATKRDKEKSKLNFYTSLTNGVRGIVMSDISYEEHRYIIDRLDLRSKILNRLYTPEELKGKYLLLFYIGLVLLPMGMLSLFFAVVGIALILIYIMYLPFYKQKVEDEDLIIDTYFIDLFLLMYSRLKMGSRARLQSVLESYTDSLEASADAKVKAVMLKFSRFFLNNLSMYEDHEAVPKLLERYHSATIRNFCNVATQALQGVNNADSLLSFKIELTRRKTDIMKNRAIAMRRKGQLAIYLTYVILFIFVVVGWYSKLPKGLLK